MENNSAKDAPGLKGDDAQDVSSNIRRCFSLIDNGVQAAVSDESYTAASGSNVSFHGLPCLR